jgi:2-polyprenyl-3-methyl-5-hydroxy-6-metoxy-1,4-benzoquinol methylase
MIWHLRGAGPALLHPGATSIIGHISSSQASTRDYAAAVGRLRRLVERGPAPGGGAGPIALARKRVRGWLLRALRPYTYYAHEVDVEVLRCLTAYEQEGRRNRRLDVLAEDLVATIEALRRRIANGESVLGEMSSIRSELRAVPYVADGPFEQFESPVGQVTGYQALDANIAQSSTGFHDLFRGPAERVRELQLPYVQLVADHQPVLDVGCGRGEFVALLTAEGIEAQGIDRDPAMVAQCAARGLAVELADVNDYLAGRQDATLGTVFSAQVVEHLSAEDLRRLLELSLHKLEPGGLFIAETVNPHSIQSLKTFWVDLTHRQPIFPEVALAMCAIAGFSPAYVFAPGYGDFEAAKFKSPTYAVVATSPAGGEE